MSFYCQNICGAEDFSIDEWNEARLGIVSLPEQERQALLFPKQCDSQCFDCMAVVGERRIKTKQM